MWQRVGFYLGVFAVVAVALVWAGFYSPAGVQRRGIHAAEGVQAQLRPKLASDRRFSQVTLSVSTRPALLICGFVPDEKAIADLHALCPDLPPTAGFDVSWNVYVDPDAATRPVR
jgi:hypothetical protein